MSGYTERVRPTARGLVAFFAVVLAVAVALVCAASAGPMQAFADESATNTASRPTSVDVNATAIIVVEQCPVDGQTFTAYQIASMDSQGKLTPVDALKDEAAVSGLDPDTLDANASAQELSRFATTYAGAVASHANNLFHASAVSKDGTARIEGLKPGLYLVSAKELTVGDTTYTSGSYVVMVPVKTAYGTEYTRTIEATKMTHTTVHHFKNQVTKLWKGDTASTRPESVDVEIYNGTKLVQTVTLNADNNWTYSWDGAGDWSVREVIETIDGYKTTTDLSTNEAIVNGEAVSTQAFTITNTNTPTTPGGSTKTTTGGRTPVLGDAAGWVIPLALLACGALCIAGGSKKLRKGREEHDGNPQA